MTISRCLLLVGGFVVLTALQGCGGGSARGTLSGKVTFNDKPLTGGTVIFVNQDASEVDRTAIQSDGTYKSENVPLGDVRVAVLASGGGVAMPAGASKAITDVPPDNPQAKLYGKAAGGSVNLPKALSDPTTSNITVKVERGANTFDIPLKAN